jgi:dephospho-CoA kinase
MAARIFSDRDARALLEAITHPRIAEASQRARQELERRGEPLACYEATLLVERGLAESFRPLVVVSATGEDQVARARARDGLSAEEARSRLEAQLPTKDKEAVADFVIKNDRDRASLVEKADSVLDSICRSLGIDAARYPRRSA